MSDINQVYVNNLTDFEYYIRDGMIFDEEQKKQIKAVCKQIIRLMNE